MPRRLAPLLLTTLLLAGCGATGTVTTPPDVDLQGMLGTLPTPTGFVQSTDVRPADAAAIQKIFAQGVVDSAAAENYESIGFEDAAVRSWRSDDGATLTVVASRWGNHQTAANVGGGAAEEIPFRDGATAWTPSSLGGARGTTNQTTDPSVTTLSLAVDRVDVFIIATGIADTAPVVRTMDLASASLGVNG
jgi:hypothetical protein